MTDKKPTIILEHNLKSLKLPTMQREYASLADSCAREGCDYREYLTRLTERELLERERKSAERRLKQAHFPIVKTVDAFDFSAQPSINEAKYRELLRCEYIDKRENVLFIGNSGTGKTHLATALGYSACVHGLRVCFYTVSSLVTALLEAREAKSLERFTRYLERQQLLVLDELGYVPFSKSGAELLFEVVSKSYERRSLIVTTNLPFPNWVEVFGTERLTGALLDRLMHRVHILESNGESYRLRESQGRLKK